MLRWRNRRVGLLLSAVGRRGAHRLAFDVRMRRVQLSDMSQPFLSSAEMTAAVMAAEGQLASVRLEMRFERRCAAIPLIALRTVVLDAAPITCTALCFKQTSIEREHLSFTLIVATWL